MSKTCQYYFSPQSPFAYLGHNRFVEIAKRHGAQVDVRPIDLGKVFSVSGGLPVGKRSPQRQAYRLKELERWSEHLGQPLKLQPAFFPVPGDPAAKLIVATQLSHGSERALALTGSIMRAVWAEDRNIGDEATLAAIANAEELDGAALLKSSDTASVQAELDRFTEEAIAASVFGSPWYAVDGEGFWGQDRLDFVDRALAK